jgi:hypothetical protein
LKAFAISFVSAYVANGVAEGTASSFGITSAEAHSVSFINSAGLENSFTIATVKAVAHGITRAAIAVAEGGSARAGFWSGFVGSGFGSTSNNFFIGTIQTAIVGGTASVLSGGKFENGARSAAFVHMFNSFSMRAISKFVKIFTNPSIDKIFIGAIKESSGKSLQYIKNGGFNQAKRDFNNLKLNKIESINTPYGNGMKGLMDDGTRVSIRPGSSGGMPTLQMSRGGKNIKIRYNSLENNGIEPVFGLF